MGIASHTHCITPTRMSNKPRVAVAFTSGSRAANGGPNTTPYSRVTAPPNRMQTRYAIHSLTPPRSDQEIRAPVAPMAP